MGLFDDLELDYKPSSPSPSSNKSTSLFDDLDLEFVDTADIPKSLPIKDSRPILDLTKNVSQNLPNISNKRLFNSDSETIPVETVKSVASTTSAPSKKYYLK